MRRKIFLMLLMMLVFFSMVACTKAKSDEEAKVENITSTAQKTEKNIKEEQSKLDEVSSNSNEVKRTEEIKNEKVVTEPAEEKITDSNADVIASTTLYEDTDIVIANELFEKFGRKTLLKGNVINLKDYCDWDSFSEWTKVELLTGIMQKIELNDSVPDLSDPSIIFNVFDEADMVFEVTKSLGDTYCLSCFVKK